MVPDAVQPILGASQELSRAILRSGGKGGGTRPYREMEERVHFMWSTNNYQKKVLLRVTDRNRMLLLYLKLQKYAINKRNFLYCT